MRCIIVDPASTANHGYHPTLLLKKVPATTWQQPPAVVGFKP